MPPMRTDEGSARRRQGAGMPAPLRRDVRLLGGLLGQVLEEAGGPELLADVERLRHATIALREGGQPGWARHPEHDARRREVVELVAGFDLDRAESVARAFTVYLQLVNLAEERHRVRILRERGRGSRPVKDSLAAAVEAVRAEEGEAGLARLLGRLEVNPVLTAHPTEARRRAVVDALRRVGEQVDRLDDEPPGPPGSEVAEVRRRLLEEISILWRTAQLRDERPSPLDEVRSLMSVFDESLFRLVPKVYRELDPALGASLGADAADLPAAVAAIRKRSPGEPHRQKLLLAAERLAATRAVLAPSAHWLAAASQPRGSGDGQDAASAYPGPDAFLADLRLVQASLVAAGAPRLAYGELQHLVWQTETFGFHLASLEVRQHASVHAHAVRELAGGISEAAA